MSEALVEKIQWKVKYESKCIKLKQPGGDEEWVNRIEYAERFGKAQDLAEEPEIPDCIEHVWEWFWILNSRRQAGFDSQNPLTYTEIQAWINVTGTYVLPEEIEALIAMDSAYLSAMAENRETQRNASKGK